MFDSNILIVQACGLVLIMVGGLSSLQAELDQVVEAHSGVCQQHLEFGRGDNCLVIMCQACDFCHYVGGF